VIPRCHDCLSEDVAVKVIDPCDFEHWFCAEDWAAWQEFHERVATLLKTATELPMSKDDKARKLLMEAWIAFDMTNRQFFYVEDEAELDEITELAEKIIRGTS
jgi:hypothetical protein